MANKFIPTETVHVIAYNGREFDRVATPWEIAKEKKNGVLKVNNLGQLVFDFRHLK